MKAFLKVAATIGVLAGAGWGTVHFVQQAEAKATVAKAEAEKAAPPSAKPATILSAEGWTVQTESVPFTVSAIGSLVANEAVEITSEQSRRLVAIHVQEGQDVKKGDLLFELDTSDPKATLAEMEARRQLAIQNENRLRQLVEAKTTSQAEYDRVRSELDVVNAQIEQVKTQIGKASITAPFNGRIGLRRVSLGAWVETDTVLTTLQDLSRIKIDFKVPERFASEISTGLEFAFRPDGSGQSYQATVIAVEPAIDSQTRSLIVRGLVDNTTGDLLPGAFVKVDLPIRTDPNGILVPTEAIIPAAKGSSVFVAEDGKARLRPVELGVRLEDRVQVLSGLKAGDTVLTTNLLRLRPGSSVAVNAAN